jgi:hypothetical protein
MPIRLSKPLAHSLLLAATTLAWTGCTGSAPPPPPAKASSQEADHAGHDHDHAGHDHDHAGHDHDHAGHDHDHAGHDHAESAKTGGKTADGKVADDHGHDDHGHDDHETGPNGGHVLHVGPSGLHAEYTHIDAENRIEVFVNENADKATAASMTVKLDGEVKTYPFAPIDGKPGGFSIVDAALLTALKMGDAVEVRLMLNVDGKELTTAVVHHEH